MSASTSPATTYSYDPDGNTISRTTGSSSWNFAWDTVGHLLSASNSSGLQGIYGYDGLGRRIESKEAATTTFYSYHGTETLSELASTGTSTDYVYADGMRIARMGYFVPTNYYHTDALGSTRLVTDANGNVVFSDSYQPYGQDNLVSGSETYKFTGKPVSTTTGLC